MTGDSDNNVLDNIKNNLQDILNRKFSTDGYIKRKIDIFRDRWNFACPYCSDSKSDTRKKRGNLYMDNLRYKCFNCGHSTGINKMLSDFGKSLNDEDKIAIHEIQQNAKKFEKRNSSTQSSMSFRILDQIAIPKMILFNKLNLISPYKNKFVSDYLISRKIDIRLWKYFAFNEYTKELYILNINQNDRIIGYQIRQLDPNSKKSRYCTTKLSSIYKDIFDKDINLIVERILSCEDLGKKYIEEEDGIENITYNLDRLSGMFNIMNVNMSNTLTIMEGPIDSMSIPNSIALQGASKSLNGFFDEMDNIRFLFDNDKMGKEMSIKKLKDHKKVFLWSMYMNTISTKDKIKDINDLQKKDLLNMENIEKCFSDDEFDVMMI